MRRAFKYRLFTNTAQERELGTMLETHRRLYNDCLAQRKTCYDTKQKAIRYADQSAWFKNQRKVNSYFARLNFSSAQATMRRLDKAFEAFFRRVKAGEKPGYPRFKARDRMESIEFPAYGDGIKLMAGRLRVQHVGVIKAKIHRTHEGVIKTATVKQEGGKWFLILSCDLGEVVVPKSDKPAVGIDVGLTSFLTTSDGEQEPNPRFLKTELPQLRRAARSVNRKKKGGKNRRKAVKQLSALHCRVRNLRREHHHQTALKLTRRYGLIAVEDLNIQGMLKNHRLARAISDAGWFGFRSILNSKAEKAGVEVVAVNPRGTSQACSHCGEIVRKELSERWHHCRCGCSLDRDVNAARNILARSQARTGPAGHNVEVTLHVPRSRLF